LIRFGVISRLTTVWLFCSAAASAGGRAGSQSHQQAVDLARRGQLEASLAIFDSLHQEDPGDAQVLHDYVLVLSWAEKDEQAVSVASRLDLDSSPVYVQEAVARSLRNLKRYDEAARVYRGALKRDPARWQSSLGLALTLVDTGRTDQALVLTTSLADTHPDNVEVQLGAAYVRRVRGEYLDSIQYLDRVLLLDPRHQDAFRLRILMITELGAPFLATAESEKWPEALTADDRYRLDGDRLARRINWSELPPKGEAETERFEETDRALAGIEPLLERTGLEAPGAFLRARFDHLLALRYRVEMEAIIAAWKTFVEEEKKKEEEDRVDIPFYIHRAVGDAYLYLEQTDEAVQQYRRALLKRPKDSNARFSLFYALIEDEHFAEAFEVIDRLAAEEPIWRTRPGLKEPQPNPRRLAAELTAALGRAFADQLEEAERRLALMSAEAPLNTDIRSELAMVYRRRGWPTKALREFELALRIEPELLGARIGRAQTRIDLGQFEEAEKRVYELVERFPEHKHVQRLEKDWKRENIWRLFAEGGVGRSTGEQLGTRDRLFDTFIYSPRLGHRFRPYAHFLFSDADFPEGTSRYARFGMGVDHNAHRSRIFGEVHASVVGETDPGITLGVNWNPDDRWGLGGRYESFSTEVPLRAHLRDIQGYLFRMNLAYRSSDLTADWL
jgi:biofilm PGA synthesis protein PgaA